MSGYSTNSIRNTCTKLVIRNDIAAHRLLDIGGSTGEFTKAIASLVGAQEVFIVDTVAESLASARRFGFKTLQMDASVDDLPFSDGTFDMVLMIELIEHLDNPDHCITECRRILRNNGFLLLSTPNLAWWVNRLTMLLGYQPYYSEPSARINIGKFSRSIKPYQTSGHIRLFTFKAILDFLRYYEFEVIDYIGAPGGHKNRMFNIADRILSKRSPLAADIGVLAVNHTRTNLSIGNYPKK